MNSELHMMQLVKLDEDEMSLTTLNDENDLSFDTDEDSDDDSLGSTGHAQPPTSTDKVKKKRQRLTHLSANEKLERRKQKNRVAAQSARDRKKVKMDELEETVTLLQKQNAALTKENALLKQKTQLLIDNQRKLLSAVQSTPIQAQGLKRKLDDSESSFVAVESAVFHNHVSQPQKQLQVILQRLVCALAVFSMTLDKSLSNSSSSSPRAVALLTRQQRVQSIMQRLVKMQQRYNNNGHCVTTNKSLRSPSETFPSRTLSPHAPPHQLNANLMLLLSFVTRFLRRSPTHSPRRS